MKNPGQSRCTFAYILFVLLLSNNAYCQVNTPAPYCAGPFTSGNCSQPGPSNTPGNGINDFIDSFFTSGATTDITNTNTGCNGLPDNYIYYCQHQLVASPNQTISCHLLSSAIFLQNYSIFVDWDQNGFFDFPTDFVVSTASPAPPATWTVLAFTIPPGQATGMYRLRIRCSGGSGVIAPCNSLTFGETEDYNMYIGSNPPAPLTATLSASSVVCDGQSTVILLNHSATGTATPTFSWTGPNSFTTTLQNPVLYNITPAMAGTYNATISSGGCTIFSAISLSVSQSPTLVVNSASICPGKEVTLVANGALSYSWNTGATSHTILVSPTLTTVYTVTGTSSSCSVAKTVTVSVPPSAGISSSSSLICAGETTTLTASGIVTYTWSDASHNKTLVVSPGSTTSYTVSGHHTNCETNAVFIQMVDPCTGMDDPTDPMQQFRIYPNPFANEIHIITPGESEIAVYNTLGQLVLKQNVATKTLLTTNTLKNGIYYVTLTGTGAGSRAFKIIKN